MPQVTFIICSIFPSIKHRIAFYLQKKHPISCVCEKFVVLLSLYLVHAEGKCQ